MVMKTNANGEIPGCPYCESISLLTHLGTAAVTSPTVTENTPTFSTSSPTPDTSSPSPDHEFICDGVERIYLPVVLNDL
jgi:hypothetical protein